MPSNHGPVSAVELHHSLLHLRLRSACGLCCTTRGSGPCRARVNGAVGIVICPRSSIIGVVATTVVNDRITEIDLILDRNKLADPHPWFQGCGLDGDGGEDLGAADAGVAPDGVKAAGCRGKSLVVAEPVGDPPDSDPRLLHRQTRVAAGRTVIRMVEWVPDKAVRRQRGSLPRLMAADRIVTSVLPMEKTHGSTVLETDGLTKRFGDRAAVAGLDLRVQARCAFGLLGPNGAGKTTLIRMVLGLTQPTSETVRLLGLTMPAGRARALSGVGAIVEEPRFHLHLTGRENLMIAAAVRDASAPGR
jgi:ABC-type multidrug transport system fused ATPase/permease subunit